jgi:coenzyme F420-0:L-glutamate ligase/coenzyme F420-1:gamma-L-glutamate ligase
MVQPGDDLPALVVDTCRQSGLEPVAGDVVVVTSKIVSKAEGQVVDLRTVEPSERAHELAATTEKEPELVELILRESTDIVRAVPGVLLVRHRLGFMSANAAIDRSNADGTEHTALLMPREPDASAAALKAALDAAFAGPIGVVVTDTHGRPFRRGNIGVAVGVAGFEAVIDMVGSRDLFGRELKATIVPIADEIAAASALVSGETSEGLPVVLVRGLSLPAATGSSHDLLFPRDRDLFA